MITNHMVPAGRIDVFSEISEFAERLYSRQCKYLGSDLIQKGFTSDDLQHAIARARDIVFTSGRNPSAHFVELYTEQDGVVIRDCRLSALGYMMVVINGPSELELVAKMQLQLLKRLLTDG